MQLKTLSDAALQAYIRYLETLLKRALHESRQRNQT